MQMSTTGRCLLRGFDEHEAAKMCCSNLNCRIMQISCKIEGNYANVVRFFQDFVDLGSAAGEFGGVGACRAGPDEHVAAVEAAGPEPGHRRRSAADLVDQEERRVDRLLHQTAPAAALLHPVQLLPGLHLRQGQDARALRKGGLICIYANCRISFCSLNGGVTRTAAAIRAHLHMQIQ